MRRTGLLSAVAGIFIIATQAAASPPETSARPQMRPAGDEAAVTVTRARSSPVRSLRPILRPAEIAGHGVAPRTGDCQQ